jgi:hypothetical protein
VSGTRLFPRGCHTAKVVEYGVVEIEKESPG